MQDSIATCKGAHKLFTSMRAVWLARIPDPQLASSSLDLALLDMAEPSLRQRKHSQQQSDGPFFIFQA